MTKVKSFRDLAIMFQQHPEPLPVGTVKVVNSKGQEAKMMYTEEHGNFCVPKINLRSHLSAMS